MKFPRWAKGPSVTTRSHSSVPTITMSRSLLIMNEMIQKIPCFSMDLRSFSALFQGNLESRICWPLSPSIQYSMRLNTCSMNMVCGQTHPQNNRPNTTVKRITKSTPVMSAKANK